MCFLVPCIRFANRKVDRGSARRSDRTGLPGSYHERVNSACWLDRQREWPNHRSSAAPASRPCLSSQRVRGTVFVRVEFGLTTHAEREAADQRWCSSTYVPRKNNNATRDHPPHHFGNTAHWRIVDMALQLRLGLLPRRTSRASPHRCDRPVAGRTNIASHLRRAIIPPTRARSWEPLIRDQRHRPLAAMTERFSGFDQDLTGSTAPSHDTSQATAPGSTSND